MDNFGSPEDIDDYYWVKWTLTVSVGKFSMRRYATQLALTDAFPDDCIVFDAQGKRLSVGSFEDGDTYVREIEPPEPGGSKEEYFIVGYPKVNYSAENMQITNTAYLYAKYTSDGSYVYNDQDDDTLTIGKFEFVYPPGDYGIEKASTSTDTKYYQYLTGQDTELNQPFTYALYPAATYTGFPMTVRVGDDMLYVTGNSVQSADWRTMNIISPPSLSQTRSIMSTTPQSLAYMTTSYMFAMPARTRALADIRCMTPARQTTLRPISLQKSSRWWATTLIS